MSSKERSQIEQLIKSWAQDHTTAYVIADPKDSDQGLVNTGNYLTWLVLNNKTKLDLLSLADQIELLLIGKRKKKNIDGLFCRKCQNFYEFAEANQEDGSLVCYSCRFSPYA